MSMRFNCTASVNCCYDAIIIAARSNDNKKKLENWTHYLGQCLTGLSYGHSVDTVVSHAIACTATKKT